MTDTNSYAHTYRLRMETLLADEDRRAASLQARGIAVVTTSGTLVTLQAGLATLVLRNLQFQVPEGVQLLAASAALFAIAAIFGLLTSWTRPYSRPEYNTLSAAIEGPATRMSDSKTIEEAEEEIAKSNLNAWKVLKGHLDKWTVNYLRVAIAAEVAAVCCLAAGAAMAILS